MKVEVDDMNNEITIAPADNDGICITENIKGTGVYIYYSEINETCQKMKSLLYEYKNNGSGNRAQAIESNPTVTARDYINISLKEYYDSDEWQELRSRRLKMDAGRCVNCGSDKDLQVHHLHYDTVFNESVYDLRTLCKRCHDDVTKMMRKKKGGVFYG